MPLSDIYRSGAIAADGSLLTVARTAADGMHVRISPFGDVAWRGALDDLPYLNGSPLTSATKVFGNYPIAFDPRDGSLLVQHTDGAVPNERVWQSRYDRTGNFIEVLPNAPIAPEGIDRVDADGAVILVSDPSLLRRMPNGELWAGVQETVNFVVGGYGPPHDDRYGGALSKLDKRDGSVKRWLGATPVPHSAIEHHGQLYVFISGTPNSPAPDQVEWVKDFPPAPTPVPPPITLLGLVPPTEPFDPAFCGTNQDGGFVAAGNACWSAGPETE